jgi:DNA ligase (NAD+)
MTPEEEAESLRSRLEQWNAEYYRYDAPTVTDSEYDRSLNRLRDLETQHPPAE